MSDQTPSSPPATMSPNAAKRLFRLLLPLFAGYWQEARATAGDESGWKAYASILRACQDVLDHAPMHPNEAKQVNVQRRLGRALERLATTFSQVLPGGCRDLESYVIDERTRKRRRSAGLNRYLRAKQKRRQRAR